MLDSRRPSVAADHNAQPVFKKCPMCTYSLRGLPRNHACPECGLRFDENCELYRAINPKQILIVWLGIFGSGWAVLQHLPHMQHFAAASAWEKVGAIGAVAWFFFVGFGIWFLAKSYRRGFEVAVTTDGLLIHLPGFTDELIPWRSVREASLKPTKSEKPQIVRVALRGRKNLNIGGVANVFPTLALADRFIEQVNSRISTHEADDEPA